MKKLIFFLFILTLVGCGGQENATDLPDPGADTTEELYFSSFDLDIDYPHNQSFEVDYENRFNGVDAEVENDLNGEVLQGDKAAAHLQPYLKQLTFTEDTAEDAVVTQVLGVFGLEADFDTFELDVTFADGTKREFDIRP